MLHTQQCENNLYDIYSGKNILSEMQIPSFLPSSVFFLFLILFSFFRYFFCFFFLFSATQAEKKMNP